MYSFSYLEPVCCSMSSSNCCFLTCIQISQEAGQVVWYSHLFKNFPKKKEFSRLCCGPHKGFGIVNEAEVDIFLELSCFFDDPLDVGTLTINLNYSGVNHCQRKKFRYTGNPLKQGRSTMGKILKQPRSITFWHL